MHSYDKECTATLWLKGEKEKDGHEPLTCDCYSDEAADCLALMKSFGAVDPREQEHPEDD